MGIFNNFYETIVLKEDSNLEKQIAMLNSIHDKVEDSEKIKLDIKKLELGLIGEKEILFELKNANLGMYVLHDITLLFDDFKAQIDYIIITKGFIYLIECKNLIGNIFIDNTGQFQREYEYKSKKIKEAIYSPYTQAVRHVDILKKLWLSKRNKLQISFQEKYFDTLWYKPLVVVSNHKSLVNMKYAPKDIKDHVVRVDNLVNYIKNDLKKYDKDIFLNKKQMEKCAKRFLELDKSELNDFSYNYKLKEDKLDKPSNEDLICELKKFRKEKANKMNIPFYYVFTDNEMNNIIKSMPISLNQLKKLNILSNIKIKCHGEDIVKIIKKYKCF